MYYILNIAVIIVIVLVILYVANYKHEIYLDNNGTTKPYKEVVDEMRLACGYGNASGVYANKAKEVIGELRAKVKLITNLNNHYVVITSGASESNNTIIRCLVDKYWAQHNAKPHILASAVEHKTTLSCLEELKDRNKCEYNLIPVDMYGHCDKQIHFKPNTCLLTVMHVNNETGCINEIGYFALEAYKRGVHFHSDLAQSFGKLNTIGEMPPDLPNTSYSISMHKLHCGNIGCLVVDPESLKLNGKYLTCIAGVQNDGLRGGTENIPQIAGALVGLNIHTFSLNESLIQNLRQYLMEYIGTYTESRSVIFLSPDESCATLLFSIVSPYAKYCNIKMRKKLLEEKIIVSIGSTCNTDVKGASHVILACGIPKHIRSGILRVSVSNDTKLKDLKHFAKRLSVICEDCKLALL
jgi:cysteine desulfurase